MQKQQVIERDFYFKRNVTISDTLKFAGIALLSNFFAYYYMLCFTYLTRMLSGSAFYIILQVFGLIPIAAFLPFFLVNQYVRAKVPHLFSLVDSLNSWQNKAFKWVAVGELIRFIVGIIPFSFTKFGVTTSPITYVIYVLFYIEPFNKFNAVIINNEVAFADVMVFLFIYSLYFFLYDFFLTKKVKIEIQRHFKYLQGSLDEKEKYYNFSRSRRGKE